MTSLWFALILVSGVDCFGADKVPEFVPTVQTNWFPFTIPDLASAATDGSDIDLSFLSPEPAGSHGFLRPRGEDVVDDRGIPVRLFGVNITAYHAMMRKEYAEPASRRLRQLGVNFVRLHYFDWKKASEGILNDDLQTLNPKKLDELDWLVYQLNRHGIYVDLNLHVARGFAGLPPGWNNMGKGLDMLHEPYVLSELRYARDLVTHVNPYSKLRYADNPGVAVIELNNENTALHDWYRYADLPDDFRAPLQKRWNQWLTGKYATTAALAKTWGEGYSAGTEVVRNGDFSAGTNGWQYGSGGGSGDMTLVADPSAPGGRYLRWDVRQPGSASRRHLLMQTDFKVVHGKPYVVTFSGKARKGGNQLLECSIMMQQPPWKNVSGTITFRLTDTWETYRMSFEINNPGDKPVRLNFNCNNQPGTIGLSGMTCHEGVVAALGKDETLETGTIPLVGTVSAVTQKRDYVRFLFDCETNYIGRFRQLLVGELRARQMIYCTQVTYGGTAGIVRETTTGDVIDCHAYPSHPFTVNLGGKTVLGVRNVPLTGEAFSGLADLPLHRVDGKPYFVTEFDLNPPNDFCAQAFPMLATLASYQGWSGILDYVWHSMSAGPGTTHIKSVWATVGHSGQVAFMPASALMFRLGLVRKAAHRITLSVPRETALDLSAASVSGLNQPDWAQAGVGSAIAWCNGTALRLTDGGGNCTASEQRTADPASRLVSDTGEIVVDRSTAGSEYLAVNAPGVRFVIGCVAGKRFALGDVSLSFGEKLHRNFAQACLVALDGRPAGQSRRLLLTLASRVENKGMAYTADRSLCQWGEAPVMAEPVPMSLELPGSGWRVWALDGGGHRRTELSLDGSSLTTRAEDATMWYLFVR